MPSNVVSVSLADLEGLSPATIEQLAALLDRRNDSLSIAFYREFLRVVWSSSAGIARTTNLSRFAHVEFAIKLFPQWCIS